MARISGEPFWIRFANLRQDLIQPLIRMIRKRFVKVGDQQAAFLLRPIRWCQVFGQNTKAKRNTPPGMNQKAPKRQGL
jgi:hypothetical protein